MYWPFSRPAALTLVRGRVTLRTPNAGDHREWARLRDMNRDFLQPWESEWGPDDLGRAAWRERLRRYRREMRRGSGYPFLIFVENGKLAGGISIGNIRRGVAQSSEMGYWLAEEWSGQGVMAEAIAALCPFAFGQLGLHRIEAACIPENRRSARVLEKAGFLREGTARSYLKIAGAWRDHDLYALVNDRD